MIDKIKKLKNIDASKVLLSINIIILALVTHPILSINSQSQFLAEAKHHAYSPTDVYDNNVKLKLLKHNSDDIDYEDDDEFDNFVNYFNDTGTSKLLKDELDNGNKFSSIVEEIVTNVLKSSITWKFNSIFFQMITVVFMFHLFFTNPLGNETFAAVTSLIFSCLFSSFFINMIAYETVFVLQYISFGIAWVLAISCDAKKNRFYAIFSFCSLMATVIYNIISPVPLFPNSTGPMGLILKILGLDPDHHIILLRLGYIAILYLISAAIYLKIPSVIVSGPSESEEIEASEKQTIFVISIVCCWTLTSAIGESMTLFFNGANPFSPDNTFLTPSLVGFNVITIVSLAAWIFSAIIMWEGYGVWYNRGEKVVERSIPVGYITEKWRIYSNSS